MVIIMTMTVHHKKAFGKERRMSRMFVTNLSKPFGSGVGGGIGYPPTTGIDGGFATVAGGGGLSTAIPSW